MSTPDAAPVDDAPVDAYTAYLREASRFPLLSATQEAQLARGIAVSRRYVALTARYVVYALAFDDPIALGRLERVTRRAQPHARLRKRFAEHNLLLVANVAGWYRGRGLPLIDLVSLGNIGLMLAIDSFDWRRGNRFSTHATWQIRQAIGRGLVNTSRMIRLPVYVDTARGKAARRDEDVPYAQEARPPISLEKPVHIAKSGGAESVTTIGDLLPDTHAESLQDAVEREAEQREVVQTLLAVCTWREAVIIAKRMCGQTQEVIARNAQMSRTRVQQLEASALMKLRTHHKTTPKVRNATDLLTMPTSVYDLFGKKRGPGRTQPRLTRAGSIHLEHTAKQGALWVEGEAS